MIPRAQAFNKMKVRTYASLRRAGWDVRRIKTDPLFWVATVATRVDEFDIALLCLLRSQAEVSIVQVGANDGSVADPLYQTVTEYPHKTRILLVEPQESLTPLLSSAYEGHPGATISNHAVGEPGLLHLYAVDPDCWDDCVRYKDWPVYRAPTGITSASRDHVVRWVRANYRGPRSVDDVVVRLEVPSLPLPDLLVAADFGGRVDVLQVDVEGFDDEVIYGARLESLRPTLVAFEHLHLSRPRLEDLVRHLSDLNYRLAIGEENVLAVLAEPIRHPGSPTA
jgi:FkbM family methyltransferase